MRLLNHFLTDLLLGFYVHTTFMLYCRMRSPSNIFQEGTFHGVFNRLSQDLTFTKILIPQVRLILLINSTVSIICT